MVDCSSPYFDKRQRTGIGTPLGSSYFIQSPSSVWGSVTSNRSLLFWLTTTKAADVPACRRRKDAPQNSLSCRPCAATIDAAIGPFQCCSIFRERWQEQRSCGSGESECWKRAENVLDQSLRHLCLHRCYMRAFAPCRDWFLLRKDLHQMTDISLDSLLAGWRCSLIPEEKDALPRTCFIAPDGMTFLTAAQVLQHFGIATLSKVEFTRFRDRSRGAKRNQPDSSPSSCLPQSGQLEQQVTSPLGLLEELFGNDPWQLLLSAILLNRTGRVQVDTVMFAFLEEWPSAQAAAQADAVRMAQVLRPLGIRYRRSAGIIRFSREYLVLLQERKGTGSGAKQDSDAAVDAATCGREAAFSLTRNDILNLFHCGEYAYCAYQLFIRRDNSGVEPADYALRAYVEYQKGLALASSCKNRKTSRRMLQYGTI